MKAYNSPPGGSKAISFENNPTIEDKANHTKSESTEPLVTDSQSEEDELEVEHKNS